MYQEAFKPQECKAAQCVPEQGKSQLCADLLGGPFGM